MTCPPGRVKTRDQPSTAALPVLVMTMLEVRPVFQALTVSLIRHVPTGGAVVGGAVVGGTVVGGTVVGGTVVGGTVVGGGEVSNWVKNLHTSAGTQVRDPLSPVAPSWGAAMCPPSKAAHSTGY